jgi:prepilin-type N-terminal cleavage/methylation domain-containing protein
MSVSARMPAFSHPHQSSTRQPRYDGPRAQDGFTLIEVLIAAVVLVVGLTVLFGLLDSSVKATAATRTREGATSLAREILEDTRTLGYSTIGPNSIVGELQAMHGLANTSGGATWQIARRGVTYTVVVNACAIDDPKDGWGKHVNAFNENPFCKDPGEQEYKAGETVEDSQPEDLKRITAEVTWIAKGRKPVVRQVETLTSAGGQPGLNASGLKLYEPNLFKPATAPIVYEAPVGNKLVFSVQSPAGTSGMQWSLDGVRQENEPEYVKSTEWRFSWSIPLPNVSDGTYQVGVQAVDATGVHGPPISIPVTLIRTEPAAPKVSYGGFNEVYVPGSEVKKKVVELQWQPDSERNVIGYRVFNQAGTEVCPGSPATLSLQPSCIDFGASGSPSSLTYSVVALYRQAALPERIKLSEVISPGPAGTFTTSTTPKTPNELGEVQGKKAWVEAEKNPEGPVILKWKAPAGGPPIAFYRIYRGSPNYTERYGVASAASTEFTDNSATTPHQYWVTAVSETMTESPFAGPLGPL